MKPIKTQMQTTNSSKNSEELRANYNEWAEDYDQDLIEKLGYRVPSFALDFFTKYVRPSARVLDVGSGTGLVGELLQQLNFDKIEALDLSENMLKVAKSKAIYQAYYLEVLGLSLSLMTNSYDGIIAVGTFGPTHAPANTFDELIRITKSGGYILFSMRENEIPKNGIFRNKMNQLEKEQKWLLIKESTRFQGFSNKSKEHLYFKVFIFKVF